MASSLRTEFPALPPWGYQVSGLQLSAPIIEEPLAEANQRGYVPVFKEVGGKEPDMDRLQSRLPKDSKKLSDTMKLLHQELRYAVRSHDRNYIPTLYSFMKSNENGIEQAPHQDHTAEAISKVTDKYPDTIPCSLIVALEAGTRLKVFNGCFTTADRSREQVVELQPGWCLLFRGDLVYCGMPYSQVNYRLHYYVTLPGFEFEPDIVTGINETEFKYEFCGRLELTSTTIRHPVQLSA